MNINILKQMHSVITLSLLLCAFSVGATSIQKPAIMSALSSKVLLTDSERLTDGSGFVGVGLHGHIVTSKNGSTWVQAKSPVQILLTKVFFLDAQLGWATGHDAVILHTKDGGENWELQYEDPIPNGDIPKPLLDIYFKDARHGVAVGAYGLMLKTADGGKHWEPEQTDALYEKLDSLDLEPEPNFNSLIPFGGKLLIAGELGTILIFDPEAVDDESRWEIISSPYEGSFFGVKETQKDGLYIYGLRGNIYNSKDAGESWSKIETGVVSSIYDCIELSNGTLAFLGAGGTILSLSPGGQATTKQTYSGFDGFMSGQVLESGDLLLFGSLGVKTLSVEVKTLSVSANKLSGLAP